MGRPPCCDKVGIKKGPWTPEEDIILVSYIQQHGPGNWRSVPTNTGLLRCSKSCRLRWTNYLRPGIKRGNFTSHEEGMIIHLQALLGNKWATIASYLPQRTDNDVKNYWNTHLKKKLNNKVLQSPSPSPSSAPSSDHHVDSSPFTTVNTITTTTTAPPLPAPTSSSSISSTTTSYASSTENISRLLEGWMKSSNGGHRRAAAAAAETTPHNYLPTTLSTNNNNNNMIEFRNCFISGSSALPTARPRPKVEVDHRDHDDMDIIGNDEELGSMLGFEELNGDDQNNHISNGDHDGDEMEEEEEEKYSRKVVEHEKMKQRQQPNPPPLSFLEKWLVEEEGGGEGEADMEMSSIF